jgi:hypothetical protein
VQCNAYVLGQHLGDALTASAATTVELSSEMFGPHGSLQKSSRLDAKRANYQSAEPSKKEVANSTILHISKSGSYLGLELK